MDRVTLLRRVHAQFLSRDARQKTVPCLEEFVCRSNRYLERTRCRLYSKDELKKRWPDWEHGPVGLFVRGTLWSGPSLAIVGSRSADNETLAETMAWSRQLSLAGVAVVSGLARGVDGAAHRGALLAKSPTFAFMATGLDRVYPSEHRSLAEEILKQGGAWLSPFPPGFSPRRHHFPARNYLMAAMADKVLVMGAGRRSGTLITAGHAADLNKDVFVKTPKRTWESGSRELIDAGAIEVGSWKSLLEDFGRNVPQVHPIDLNDLFPSGRRVLNLSELQGRSHALYAKALTRLRELSELGHVCEWRPQLYFRLT